MTWPYPDNDRHTHDRSPDNGSLSGLDTERSPNPADLIDASESVSVNSPLARYSPHPDRVGLKSIAEYSWAPEYKDVCSKELESSRVTTRLKW
jgi:hypothetical protein